MPKLTQRVQRLAKWPCQAKVGPHVCGDRWREVTFKGKRRINTTCYVNGHAQDKSGKCLVGPVQMRLPGVRL